jgi:hypothetical protein
MVSILSELELCSIEHMAQKELVQAIRGRMHDLPVDLLGQLEEQSRQYLQLLLMAGRLIYVLRHLRSRGEKRGNA